MDDNNRRPRFIESWLDDLREDVRLYGATSIVPWRLLGCLIVGIFVAKIIPYEEFLDNPDRSMVFFTAILTLNGLLLALSWSSFSKIYEIASRPVLAKYLRSKGILNSYIFQIDYIHYAQVSAISFSAIALLVCIINDLPSYFRYLLTIEQLRSIMTVASVASSIYAMNYALGSVRIMQDLVWYSSHQIFNEQPDLTVLDGTSVNGNQRKKSNI